MHYGITLGICFKNYYFDYFNVSSTDTYIERQHLKPKIYSRNETCNHTYLNELYCISKYFMDYCTHIPNLNKTKDKITLFFEGSCYLNIYTRNDRNYAHYEINQIQKYENLFSDLIDYFKHLDIEIKIVSFAPLYPLYKYSNELLYFNIYINSLKIDGFVWLDNDSIMIVKSLNENQSHQIQLNNITSNWNAMDPKLDKMTKWIQVFSDLHGYKSFFKNFVVSYRNKLQTPTNSSMNSIIFKCFEEIISYENCLEENYNVSCCIQTRNLKKHLHYLTDNYMLCKQSIVDFLIKNNNMNDDSTYFSDNIKYIHQLQLKSFNKNNTLLTNIEFFNQSQYDCDDLNDYKNFLKKCKIMSIINNLTQYEWCVQYVYNAAIIKLLKCEYQFNLVFKDIKMNTNNRKINKTLRPASFLGLFDAFSYVSKVILMITVCGCGIVIIVAFVYFYKFVKCSIGSDIIKFYKKLNIRGFLRRLKRRVHKQNFMIL